MLVHVVERKTLGSAFVLAAVAYTAPAGAQSAEWRIPSNHTIRSLIAERNAVRPGQGIVIGVLGADSARIVAGGTGAAAAVIALPVAELEKFVGRYAFDAGLVLSIARRGDYLYALREDTPGASNAQILPESAQAFFWKEVDAQIRFTTDASGVVTGAVMTADGQQLPARRLAS